MALASLRAGFRPEVMVLCSVVSIQVGAALAVKLFDVFSIPGVLFLRMFLAGMLLVPVYRKTILQSLSTAPGGIVLLGIFFAMQNGAIMASIARIPLGIAISICFLGPLGVAVATSRRIGDFLWILVAALGIGLLTPEIGVQLDHIGIALAFCSAVGWAGTIILNRHVARATTDSSALALSMLTSGFVVLPFGGRAAMLGAIHFPYALGLAIIMAVFSTALPLALEFNAMKTLPPSRYGVLVATEPVVATVVGLTMLGQHVGWNMWGPMALIVTAAIAIMFKRASV